jgi:hypothetical protein
MGEGRARLQTAAHGAFRATYPYQKELPVRPHLFTKVFVPMRLVVGLGVAAVGALVLVAIFLFLDHVRLSTLAIGPTLVALGVGAALSSRADACGACHEVLERTRMEVPIELDATTRAAVQATAHGFVDGVLGLKTVPLTSANAAVTASVELDYCPACQQLGRIAAGHRRNQNGFSTLENVSPRVTISGWPVAHVLAAMTARNEAWSRAVYGGVLRG